jgi:hypothetical protein
MLKQQIQFIKQQCKFDRSVAHPTCVFFFVPTMSRSEDSESGKSGNTSAMASGSSIAIQDRAALRSTPVAEWSIQQVATFMQSQGVEDVVVQRTVAEMLTGVELLALQNVRQRKYPLSLAL